MILKRLFLKNFKKYQEKEFDFTTGLIGIIGRNGSGKSTIFEAILFALYGELKNSKGYKEIIKNVRASDKDSVEVSLSFEFENAEYEIIREFRGKNLNATAKLFKSDELLASSAKEVSQRIVELTKLNKNAFIHTLFASQKELTALSNMKNEDRKKMIRKLLGLEKIDNIEKELVEKIRENKRDIISFEKHLMSDEEIKNFVEEKTLAIQNLNTLEKDIQVLLKSENEQKQTIIKEKLELESLQKIKEEKEKLQNEANLINSSIKAKLEYEAKLIVDIESLKTKEIELKKLENISSEYNELNIKLQEQISLKEIELKKQGLIKEQVALRSEYKNIKKDIEALQEQIKDKESKEKLYTQVEKNLNETKVEIEDLNKKIATLNEKIASEQNNIQKITKKVDSIKKLGKDSPCPTCTRPLLEEYDKVIGLLENEIKELNEKVITTNKNNLTLLIKTIEEKNKEFKIIESNYSKLSSEILIIESKSKDLQKQKSYFEEVEKKGLKNKNELTELEKFSYDENIHKNLEDKLKEIKPLYEKVLTLTNEIKRKESLIKELDSNKELLTTLDKNLKEKNSQFENIKYDSTQHENIKLQLVKKEKEFEELKENINSKKIELEKIKASIARIDEILQKNEKQKLQLYKMQEELKDYEKIKIHLSEFKTKLNSKVAPRISTTASKMFNTITRGKYQHIEVDNEFDFFVYDEGVKYPIERFSGGEIDLANLVLRIAISKTLNELSGANSIEFLAFDEIFGSQDESRRMEILEAFHLIKEQYRQIFLISHEMEIKDSFENVVEL